MTNIIAPFFNISCRAAQKEDLPALIELLFHDELGATREILTASSQNAYSQALEKIMAIPQHHLMIVTLDNEIVATCHLILIPSLQFRGSNHLQIEAVRVSTKYRRCKIGSWMMSQVKEYARRNDAHMIQLMMHKERDQAQFFYKSLGFEATHTGFKMTID